MSPLAKSALIPLGLTAAASAADTAIQKKRISLDQKSLEDAALLIKGVGETVENEAIEEIGEFLSMLLDTIGPILLGNLIIRKGV